ncbi:hypothetical protein [Candidatus Ichthyocystis sparus]|uniref:hypothetical protein n=1 Tax=Candidatus Ichthyocystis sparus TaxID=1561004 RepID=UPI000B253DD1|nr:hypothetical protein [Candidatus Ichthyocystis sparus]
MIHTDGISLPCGFLERGGDVADCECTTTVFTELDSKNEQCAIIANPGLPFASIKNCVAAALTVLGSLVECTSGERDNWCNLESSICNLLQTEGDIYGVPDRNHTKAICEVLSDVGINNDSNCSLPLLSGDYNRNDTRLRVAANAVNIMVSRTIFPNESSTDLDKIVPGTVSNFEKVLSGHDCNISIIDNCINLTKYLVESGDGPRIRNSSSSQVTLSTTSGETLITASGETLTTTISPTITPTTPKIPTTKLGISPHLIVAIFCGVCFGLFILATLLSLACKHRKRNRGSVNIRKRNNEFRNNEFSNHWVDDKYRRLHLSSIS